jgi:hypothetical protein
VRPCLFFLSSPVEDATTPVYVYHSADERFCGMTIMPDGRNLPSLGPSAAWNQKDVVPLKKESLAAYVGDAVIAIGNLILRGYHVSRSTAVVPYPHRSSS